MCEDEGNRGGDGTAEAARCGIGGKGTGGLCQWSKWGGGQWMVKWGKVMRKMLGKVSSAWEEVERR